MNCYYKLTWLMDNGYTSTAYFEFSADAIQYIKLCLDAGFMADFELKQVNIEEITGSRGVFEGTGKWT